MREVFLQNYASSSINDHSFLQDYSIINLQDHENNDTQGHRAIIPLDFLEFLLYTLDRN